MFPSYSELMLDKMYVSLVFFLFLRVLLLDSSFYYACGMPKEIRTTFDKIQLKIYVHILSYISNDMLLILCP